MFLDIHRKEIPILFKLILCLSGLGLLLLASIGYSYRVSSRLYQTNFLIESTDSVITQLNLLELKLADCESNVVAFAASKKVPFLYKYENSRTDVRNYLLALEKLTADQVRPAGEISQLKELVKDRLRMLEKAIAIEKGKETDEKGQQYRSNQARLVKGKIQAQIMALKEELNHSLRRSKQASWELLRNNKLANKFTIALGGLLTGLLGLVVIKEIRGREQTERKLRMLNDQKNQFFSIISHDLRGPTRNTAILLEMMDDPEYAATPEESKKIAGLAVESARQTQKLVEDLLAWGRLQMNQVEIVTTRFKPYELAEKVCQSLQSAAVLKEITLENRIPRTLFVQGDRNMVETVIRNLVSNAIKFTPPAGKVKVEARPFGDFVELVVADSGVGMSPETVDKIFSFHQKHTTKGTAGESGTGLGLALCREFVERNGGTIGVESQVGQGSKFNVRLPAAETAE